MAGGEKLLVVLSEGFSGSYYFKYSNETSFHFFEQNGVWSDFVFPEFPSLSLPNQYTLVTGKLIWKLFYAPAEC